MLPKRPYTKGEITMLAKQRRSKLDRLGHQIAAISAEATIESCCPYQPNVRPRWYDTRRVPRIEKRDVAMSVKYLELRGMLKRNPSNADLVRCRRAGK